MQGLPMHTLTKPIPDPDDSRYERSYRADLAYFAFVNYATLGYGDITPVEPGRLLGPITAMNGMLLFGWSTAVIFEMLRRPLMKVDMLS